MVDSGIVVRDEDAREYIAEVRQRAMDMRPVWRSLQAVKAADVGALFELMGHSGGTHFGVTWAPFADQYTRKTDGVTVPAEGGVSRLRAGKSTRGLVIRKTRAGQAAVYGPRLTYGISQLIGSRRFIGGSSTGAEGVVRGRLRPSGRRIDSSSKLMQDTGALRAGAINNNRITADRLVMSIPRDIGYARYQHARRPILFWTRDDERYASDEAARYLLHGGSASASAGAVAAPEGSILAAFRSRRLG